MILLSIHVSSSKIINNGSFFFQEKNAATSVQLTVLLNYWPVSFIQHFFFERENQISKSDWKFWFQFQENELHAVSDEYINLVDFA